MFLLLYFSFEIIDNQVMDSGLAYTSEIKGHVPEWKRLLFSLQKWDLSAITIPLEQLYVEYCFYRDVCVCFGICVQVFDQNDSSDHFRYGKFLTENSV